MAIDTKNQLALHQARKDQLTRSSQYIESFLGSLDPATDYTRSACPTCNQRPNSPLFIKNKGEYAYCPRCDHIFLQNPLVADKLLKFYTDYPTSSLEWHHNESEFYRAIYQRGIDLFGQYRSGAKLLDIGCSSGYFLSIAAQQGYLAYGIEPNSREASYASNNGINIVGSTIDSLSTGEETFDVVTLWDVLEHILRPVDYISKLHTLLRDRGLVFVQVPTSDSLASRIMRENCNMYDGIEHLTLFSSGSLDIAFKKAGFTCLAKNTVISEIHAVTNYLSYQSDAYLDTPSFPFKLDNLTEDYIESRGLGYKIQAVYQLGA